MTANELLRQMRELADTLAATVMTHEAVSLALIHSPNTGRSFSSATYSCRSEYIWEPSAGPLFGAGAAVSAGESGPLFEDAPWLAWAAGWSAIARSAVSCDG